VEGGRRAWRRELGGRLALGGCSDRCVAGAAEFGVKLTGGHATGEEGGERSLLTVAQSIR
jgi:hypothetical protein